MARLFDQIRQAVDQDRVIISVHAAESLAKRDITEWQAVSGIFQGRLLRERPKSRPYPCVEVEQVLPDGTPVKAVWSWIGTERFAKLVTVHFYNGWS